MSDFVVHFTKPVKGAPRPTRNSAMARTRGGLMKLLYAMRHADQSGYGPWIEILGEGRLRPGKKLLGAGRRVQAVADLHRVVCFSEIPLDMLDRLVDRRSLYGVGFWKSTLVAKGGAPVWYLDKDGRQAATVKAFLDAASVDGVDAQDPLWSLTAFVDNPGDYNQSEYRFEWEREWRVIGDFTFTPDDVAFLFLPEDEHGQARKFFAKAQVEHSGPAYLGPYIDPRWTMEAIQKRLQETPPVPPLGEDVHPWWE